MSSPKVCLEEQLALRAQLSSQLEFMESNFEARSRGVDVTEKSIQEVRRQIADVDASIERLRTGNA